MKVLKNLDATIRLVGPTSSPRLVFDTSAFGTQLRDALVDAGKAELARRATELLGDNVPGGIPDPAKALSSPDAAKDAIGGLLGGKKDDKKGEEGEKKADDSGKSAKDTLGGLFGGKKKDKP